MTNSHSKSKWIGLGCGFHSCAKLLVRQELRDSRAGFFLNPMYRLNRCSFAALVPPVARSSSQSNAFSRATERALICCDVSGNVAIGVLSLGLVSGVRTSVALTGNELAIWAALL
jgi:hypothetical protein